LALGLTYRPFLRRGKPIEVQYDDYVRVLPPERLPSTHVAFPPVDDLKSVEFWLNDLHITGDGMVNYMGAAVQRASPKGRVPEASIRALLESFQKADFFSLDDQYLITGHDFPGKTVGIRIGSTTKTVFDYAGQYEGMPHVVAELERQIDAIVDSVKGPGLAHPK
jgi:hypothetical protein